MKPLIYTSILLGLLSTAGFSQQVNQRRTDQQDRIAQGVQSGQLTPGESSSLENKERALNGEVRADRRADNGRLTGAEKQQINHQQNHLSNRIYDDKHNRAQDHFGNSAVGRREQNQQARIAQGIRNGKLNAGQSSKLEGRDAGINREVRSDRAYNGGKLTGAEKQQVNRQQNRVSRSIYRDKH